MQIKMKNYSGQIELTKLKCVILEKKGQSGMIRGIFIPITQNYLDEFAENRVGLPISIVIHDVPDKYSNDGFIGQKVDSKTYKSATDTQKEDFKKLPILGNFKNFSGGSENTEPAKVINETDDLPF
jgi:hypothetical protein